MKRALSEYIVIGVTTNIPFHRAVMEEEDFIKGNLSTHYVEEHWDVLKEKMLKYAIEAKDMDKLYIEKVFQENKKVAAIVGGLNAYISHIITNNNKEKDKYEGE